MASEKTEELIKGLRAKRQEGKIERGTSLTWGEVGTQAFQNIPSSAVKYAEDLVAPVTSPVETAKGLYAFTAGLIQLAIPGEQSDEATARAVGDYFANRYGSVDAFKNAMANDPVGVVGDVAGVLTGGGMLAARVPGTVGKVGRKIQDVGQVIDPLNIALQGGIGAKKVIAEGVPALAGMTTGSGMESIKQAFNAGRSGGEIDQKFVDNMRGVEDSQAVVEDSISALQQMKTNKQNVYLNSKQALQLEKQAVDFDVMAMNFSDWSKGFFYEGVSELSPKGQAKLKSVQKLIKDWQRSPALHNAKGLDMLKRRIDNEYPDGINPGDEAVVIAQARDLVKKQILEQVPDYNKVMQPYEEATRLERELQKALSLGKNASADTSLRKLQSVMRNNVNANFGNRLKLVEKLEEAGDYFLLPRIAGQALNSYTPRGLQAAAATSTTLPSILSGTLNPATLATLPMFSPRIMGETFRQLGRGVGAVDKVLDNISPTNLNPFQRQLMESAKGSVPDFKTLQGPAQAGRFATAALEGEEERSQMTREELSRLLNLSDSQKRLIAQ